MSAAALDRVSRRSAWHDDTCPHQAPSRTVLSQQRSLATPRAVFQRALPAWAYRCKRLSDRRQRDHPCTAWFDGLSCSSGTPSAPSAPHTAVQEGEPGWLHNGLTFYSDYTSAGRCPPIDPEIRNLWREAETKGSWEQYHDSVREVEKFRDWFRREVLPYDNETGSESM